MSGQRTTKDSLIIVEPLLRVAKIEAENLIRLGQLRAEGSAAFVRRRMNELLQRSNEFGYTR